MTESLISIAVCVVLPVLVVWLTSRKQINKTNRHAEILIEAIKRSDECFSAESLTKLLAKPSRSPREMLNQRLLCGSIFSLVGIALLLTDLFFYCTGNYIFMYECWAICVYLGVILLAIGISYFVVYFVSKKHIDRD